MAMINRGRFIRIAISPDAGPEMVQEANALCDEYAKELANWPNDSDKAKYLREDGGWGEVSIGEIKADLAAPQY